jgi:hypothetical protein
MKTQMTLQKRLTWLALLLAMLMALATPVVVHHAIASAPEPIEVAVNWNGGAALRP